MKVRNFLIIVTGVSFIGLLPRNADSVPPQAMNLIISPGNAAICFHDYSNTSATIQIKERESTTEVTIKVRGAKPNHIHTAWIKIAGPSPISGGGATPAAPTSEIDNIIATAGTAITGTNGFYTNAAGNGTLHINLDFLLSDGVYPFSRYDSSLADIPLGNTPFSFRVISHCTDDLQHGLSPGTHEPTFQIQL
ncbi:MAG: hypothetical protein OEN50_12035 [Deltaproteobacteria bacterium]|nr:hypothetical protein [Deltaproteobacteria bacterium]